MHHSLNLPFIMVHITRSHSTFIFTIFLFIKLNSTPMYTEAEANLKRDQTILQPSWKLLPGNNGEEKIFSEVWPHELQQLCRTHTVLEAGLVTLHPWLKPQREYWTIPTSCLQRIEIPPSRILRVRKILLCPQIFSPLWLIIGPKSLSPFP